MLHAAPPGATTALVPGADRLLALHDQELPQKDMLCGCFWTLLALRAAGIDVPDQDTVALAAGAVVAARQPGDVAPGEAGRDDYVLDLPRVEDSDLAGTAPAGLVRAVAELTGGSHVAVPVRGPWTAETAGAVLAIASEHDAVPVANVGTGAFWGSHPTPEVLVAFLATAVDDGPPAEWDVGHFVGLLGTVTGEAGTLVVVGDTYRSLGANAVYLQPLARVAAALAGPRRQRGVLLVAPASEEAAIRTALHAAGLEQGTWDNGSPDAREWS
jgi:hypothetical protein